MNTKTLPITVQASDICGWGDTTFWPEENNGNCAFIIEDCTNVRHNTEYIMLRNILQAIGEEYNVWRIEDWGEDGAGLIFYTNLPQDVYEKACEGSPWHGKNDLYINIMTEGSLLD